MVTMAQSAANWRNTHSRGSHAFTHTLTIHQHSYNRVVRSASSVIAEFCNQIFCEGAGGTQRGSKPEKTPDSLPANRYTGNILFRDIADFRKKNILTPPPPKKK